LTYKQQTLRAQFMGTSILILCAHTKAINAIKPNMNYGGAFLFSVIVRRGDDKNSIGNRTGT